MKKCPSEQASPSTINTREKVEETLNEEFEHKVRRGIFKPVARYLTNEPTAEDRLQDAICQTWMMYKRYAMNKDTVLNDAVLVHSCRQRATDLGRRFVGKNGTTCRNQDVMDPRIYRDGLAVVLRLDGIDTSQGDESDRSIEIGLAEAMAASPERKWNGAIDLEKWIGDLSFRDQYIMKRKWLGFSTGQIAHELDLSHSTVFHKEKKLGHELAARVGIKIDHSKERRGRPKKSRDLKGDVMSH